MTQQTLTGETTDATYQAPETMVYCPTCDEWLLRSRRLGHPHAIDDSVPSFKTDSTEDDEDEEDSPERIGAWYDVTISVSVDYRFRIPAWSDHEAKDLAEEWRFDATPADSHVVHTKTRERGEITTEDAPDDFDPYGSTLLHEALDDP